LRSARNFISEMSFAVRPYGILDIVNENFNGQFKAIFDVHGAVPTKGLVTSQQFALGAVFVYQLTLCCRHEHDLDLRVGLDPFLKAA
jgi:hypothetical protein